jgi:hypothetical protein
LPLQTPDADLSGFLSSFPDEIYQRLVCQDPNEQGLVQISERIHGFIEVTGEEL